MISHVSAPRRRIAVTLLAVGLGLSMGACDGSTAENGDAPTATVPATLDAIRHAAAATADAAAESGRYTSVIVGPRGKERSKVTGEFGSGRSRETLETDPQAPAETSAPSFAESVLDEETLYVRGGVADSIPGGPASGWFRLDRSGADPDVPAGFVDHPMSLGVDVVDLLVGAFAAVERVGSEKVRGAATTHLTATVDMELVSPASPARSLVDTGSFPVDVWIAGDGTVRRVKISIGAMMAPSLYPDQVEEAAKIPRGDIVIELFDLGADVDIAIPTDATPIRFSAVVEAARAG